jgi:hypothetical protein
MPRILLIPEGSLYLSFRLPMLFQKAGWEVDLMCLADDPMRYSRYIRTALPEKNPDTLARRVLSILNDPDHPWQAVIIAHEALMRQLIARLGDERLKCWQPGACSPPVKAFLLSKFGMADAEVSRLLAIPSSRVCRSREDIVAFGDDAGWPVMIKPPASSGGAGVIKYDTGEDLTSSAGALQFPLLAQRYIQGKRGVVDMLCAQGKPLAWLASYSTKRRDGEYSPSTARSFRAMPQLQPLVENVARFTRFEGFCGFDWIEEESSGHHYLIEFHPRPSSGFRFGRFCQVDFAAAIAAWLKREGDTFPTQVQAPGHSVEAHYFTGDLLRCLRQRDWQGLRNWLPGSGSRHDVFLDDFPLMSAWGIQRIRKLIQGQR